LNEPDFINVPSLLDEHCHARGFKHMIPLKFHCELNFIEQCWGYARRLHRLYPPTKKDEQMEVNVHKALDSIPIECMRRCSNRASRFLDGHQKGYHGHRTLPDSILKGLDLKANCISSYPN
ncbi:hypothetical protein M405DRAFT_751108, partial [Rhizopogon salebrosus TDB-379]